MNSSPYSSSALKRSAMHFISGKAVSALLSLAILLWLVRALPVAEYGVYVALIAVMELGIAIANLGLPWLAWRYLPEFRLHASHAQIQSLVWRLLCWNGAALLTFATLLWLASDTLLDQLALQERHELISVLLLIVITEGLGRQIADTFLGPLLQQGGAQLSIIFRQSTFMLLLVGLSSSGAIPLHEVMTIELTASAAGLFVALAGLIRYLRRVKPASNNNGWQAPSLRAMWRTAGHMYSAHMIALAYSPQAFLILVQHFLGAESAALFGFLRNLHGQISRYLPATLFFSMIQPKLVASYVDGGGINALTQNANTTGKLSLFILMPIIAFTAVGGDALIAQLSGNKFTDTGLLFFTLMLSLVPFSQRQILETVAVSTGHSALCSRAAIGSVLMLPVMIILLKMDLGLWAPTLSLVLGYLLFNFILLSGIRQSEYRPDINGLFKITLSAIIAAFAPMLLPPLESPWLNLLAEAITIALVFLVVAWLIKPFLQVERNRLNGFIKFPLFVW